MLKACVAFGATPLLAVTSPVYVPAAVGVPLSTPALVKVKPGGSEPEVTVKVIGAVPVAVYVWL
jgi:hypothetical protein